MTRRASPPAWRAKPADAKTLKKLFVPPTVDEKDVKLPTDPSYARTEPYAVPHNVMTPFTKSYVVLTDLFGWPGGEGKGGPARSKHGQEGSFFRRPKPWGKDVAPLFLYDFVTDGKHHDVKLSGEDLLRLTIWQDNNCNFLGAYHETERQVKGELVLPDAVQGDKQYPR